MSSRPLALDASPSDRRALRFKCFTFYGKWEPHKPITDVNDLCEWALENGVAAFNQKLKAKYGEDLSTVTINSYLDLPLEVQLKLFYSEFDPNKPSKEIEEVALWARQRGNDGVFDINQRMNKKYGENLNTMALGGRLHMRTLLEAYFRKVDPKRGTPENIQITTEYVAHNGALALIRELVERYKVGLQLSVSEIEGKEHEISVAPKTGGVDLGHARPAVKSLMRGAQPVNPLGPPPPRPVRPLSTALSTASGKNAGWSVSEDAEVRGLMEIFYAKNNPEKLSDGGVDVLMKYARINGLEALNVKLQDKYGEDLDTLKLQYSALMQQLQKYYAKVDPSKTNVEDIAAWAIVHGTQPLSERLEKRYGRGLYAEEEEQQLDPDTLRQRLDQFYQMFDKQPKSEQDLDIIVNWVMAGSISQLNKKLKEKYNADLNDLPPLEVGERVEIPIQKPSTSASTPTTAQDHSPKPETLGGHETPGGNAPPATRSPAGSVTSKAKASPPNTPPRPSRSPSAVKEAFTRERTDSFASQAGEDSMDKVEQQMTNMRRITSGQYDNLARLIRAFYRRHDPDKLENKEALDLVLKWSFKHGLKALDEKFNTHYGASLSSVELDDQDDEEEEGDDYVPDW